MSYEKLILLIFVSILVFMSLVSFILFKNDKKKAIKGKNRTKEKTLLASVVFGGAVGAFFARIIFHHKTDKIYFSLTIYLSILLEALAIVILFLI